MIEKLVLLFVAGNFFLQLIWFLKDTKIKSKTKNNKINNDDFLEIAISDKWEYRKYKNLCLIHSNYTFDIEDTSLIKHYKNLLKYLNKRNSIYES